MPETKPEKKKQAKKQRITKIDTLGLILEEQGTRAFRLEDLKLENPKKYKQLLKRMLKQEVLKEVINEEQENQVQEYRYYPDKFSPFKENEAKRRFVIVVSIVIPGILFLLLGVAWIILFT